MATRLQYSFGAVYALLEKPRMARRAVAVLLIIHTLLLGYSAYVHSPTLNEPAHLVAGLSHWKFGRFDIYNVNPPLVRLVAALPVMAVGYKEDWSGFYQGPGARPEMSMGKDFVKANGERSIFLFMIARWACIPFSWIGAIVCYLWARDLYGRPSGVLACTIWCFEPSILAHASLITPDAHAAALGLAACYTFWRWLKNPTWTQAVMNGVVLGLAELAKTTLILFYLLWPVMWFVYRWSDRRTMRAGDWVREIEMLALRMVIGIYVLNLGYGFESSLKPLKNHHFVSDMFRGESDNRFTGSLIGEAPIPFPTNYLLGIDIQQRDFEHYTEPSYLRGQWQERGWWYYYFYAVAIKVPLGLWLLGLVRLATGFTLKRDDFVLLFPAVLIFVVVSSKTGFSEHMRYVLPAFPFVFIWVSGIFLTPDPRRDRTGNWGYRSMSLFSICWLVTSSLCIYPHNLSYFNESMGGPLGGARHLLGSNVDWGQDLRYLKWWSDANKTNVRYFGDFDPVETDIVLPQTELDTPYAVSVNWLFGRRSADKHIEPTDRSLRLAYSVVIFFPRVLP